MGLFSKMMLPSVESIASYSNRSFHEITLENITCREIPLLINLHGVILRIFLSNPNPNPPKNIIKKITSFSICPIGVQILKSYFA